MSGQFENRKTTQADYITIPYTPPKPIPKVEIIIEEPEDEPYCPEETCFPKDAVDDDYYTNSFCSCIEFAQNFDNTCSNRQFAYPFAEVNTRDQTCDLADDMVCPIHGTFEQSEFGN